MKDVAQDCPENFLKLIATLLKKQTKSTILLGGPAGFEAGVSIEMIESKSDKWILDGWSVDAFGSRRSLGVGVAKDLLKRKLIEVDAGIYATKKMVGFFDKKIKPEIRIGFSANYRF